MSAHNIRDIEAEFWATWRMRWGSRLIVLAVMLVVVLVGSCAGESAFGDFRAGWDAAIGYCTDPGAMVKRCERGSRR